jgi:hypothetical protein
VVDHEYLSTGRQRGPLSLETLVRTFGYVREKAGLAREGMTPHSGGHRRMEELRGKCPQQGG